MSQAKTEAILDEIAAVFAAHGSGKYAERVSRAEHALQCAWLAEKENGKPALIAAALLHDIGHMLHKFGENPAARDIDDRHEAIGAGWLARHFGPEVSEPVRLHVDAKRYLCAVSDGYHDILSAGSVRSLELQGGPLAEPEVKSFQDNAFAEDAVALRQWDDRAKEPNLATPGFGHFHPYLRQALSPVG